MAEVLKGVKVLAPPSELSTEILPLEALKFLADLERRFGSQRRELLDARRARQERMDTGEPPNFLRETADVRNSRWVVSALPADLLDRRVEITGPVDRKMIINALNSGASTFMADFEDANAPTWANVLEGQHNLRDAVRRKIVHLDGKTGRKYKLNSEIAVLMVRPRGWHLPEKHVLVDDRPMSASLFDFGLFFWHNAKAQIARGTGPYFYLPKLESYFEARLWNQVFLYAQDSFGMQPGTIKATVLIETILAAFEMDEILYELRQHSAGLNCGRWDYIFSFIKKNANNDLVVLPDRGRITMTTHFMRSYSRLLIKTCHHREVHAIGGMSAYIPNKNDRIANDQAMLMVRADKEREASDGHDGTWVAHPGLVDIAKEVFDAYMPGQNQIHRKLDELDITAADLLEPPPAEITEAGLRQNIAVSVAYLESWLRGVGCVPLFNLMEDAATAEISRSQLWQWIHHNARLQDGRPISLDFFLTIFDEEMEKLGRAVGPQQFREGRYREAGEVLLDMIRSPEFVEFLTLPAYERLSD